MSPTLWFAGVVGAIIFFGLVQIVVHRTIGRIGRRLPPVTDPDSPSWGQMIVERERTEGSKFDADVVYWGWPVVLGTAVASAAAVASWGWWLVVLGLFMAALGLAALMARIKYGTARLRDIDRLLRREPRRRARKPWPPA